LCFFILIAVTIEAYWLIFHDSMELRHDVIAKILAMYWPADYRYRISGYGADKTFPLALESFNTVVTQWFNALLIYAIVKRRSYRHVLQLTVATLTAYGTFLYYYAAHLSGYSVFAYHGTYPFLMFYLANAPWFVGYLYLAYVSFRSIAATLKAAPAVG
jgi:hypothetical protein